MKVLFFLTNFSDRGGTERTCFLVCNELNKCGFEVHLFCLSGNKEQPAYPLDEGVKVALLDMNFRGVKLLMAIPWIVFKLNKYIQKNKISFLVSVETMSCLFTFPILLVTNRDKLKFIVWEHFNFTVDLGLKLRVYFRKLAAKHADAIVTLTLKDKEMWEQQLSPSAKMFAIYNPSPFAISSRDYSSSSFNIIAVGRFTYQKGFDLLVESWKLAIERINNINKDWKLSIIGDGVDKGKIAALINSLGLEKSVQLIANTTDIDKYYIGASFLCMSSRYEGLPMVLIEAQSYGLPVIAFDCLTGPSEILIDDSGILCIPEETNLFADAIVELISNPDKRVFMSRNAKISAGRFAPNKIAQMWEYMFEALLFEQP